MFLKILFRGRKNTSRYVFIWFAFIGLSYGIRYNCHIRIDIFETFIPKLKVPLMVIDDIGFFIFCALLWVPGWNSVTGMIDSGLAQRSNGDFNDVDIPRAVRRFHSYACPHHSEIHFADLRFDQEKEGALNKLCWV